jgi:hypothetical protein
MHLQKDFQNELDFIEKFGYDYQDPDIRYWYHKILDSAFPGVRIEASTEYRSTVRSLQSLFQKASQELNAGFAKVGEETFNPQFWEKVPSDDNSS